MLLALFFSCATIEKTLARWPPHTPLFNSLFSIAGLLKKKEQSPLAFCLQIAIELRPKNVCRWKKVRVWRSKVSYGDISRLAATAATLKVAVAAAVAEGTAVI